MAENKNLNLILSLKDNATSKLKKFSAVGIAAVGALGIASVKMAGDFEKSMGNVATLVDTSAESMAEMSQQVKDIASRSPVQLGDLSAALYDVRSAGVSSADAMMVLEQSARLGVAGLGTTGEAVNLATSAINSFGLEGIEAKNAFDILQLTVKSGKTNIAELAQSFGNVAGVASAAGIGFDELQAATAALTTTGQKASVAQTQLRASILAIQAPTDAMADAINTAGYESGSAMLKELGLVDSMKLLAEVANNDTSEMKKMYGSVEALGASISLTGEQNTAFTDTLNQMTNAEGVLDEAFNKQNETFAAQYQILKNNLGNVMIELGTSILPVLMDAMKSLTTFVSENKESIKSLATFLGTVFKGAIAIAGHAINGFSITFEKLTDWVARIIGAFNRLKRTFSNFSIPRSVSRAVSALGFADGGIVPQYFAGGGMPKGSDTVPAMLTPGEVVLNAAQQKNVAGQLNGNSITISGNNFQGTPREMAEQMFEILQDKLQANLRMA